MKSDLDLASLLASRLCHDVVGPVGAIMNGLELMAEDSAMSDMAIALIRKSAKQASSKLQYARMAYGAAGGAAELDPGEAGRLTAEMFDGERASLDWQWSGPVSPRVGVKLAMLLSTFALGAVPRGGTIRVATPSPHLEVTAEGTALRAPPFLEVLTGAGDSEDPRAAQALVMAQLAESAGWAVTAQESDGVLTLRTVDR
ncbi:MAG: histidine phosphotransferase family protein [Devosia sp.]